MFNEFIISQLSQLARFAKYMGVNPSYVDIRVFTLNNYTTSYFTLNLQSSKVEKKLCLPVDFGMRDDRMGQHDLLRVKAQFVSLVLGFMAP